jgi:hypothetical protein
MLAQSSGVEKSSGAEDSERTDEEGDYSDSRSSRSAEDDSKCSSNDDCRLPGMRRGTGDKMKDARELFCWRGMQKELAVVHRSSWLPLATNNSAADSFTF